MKTAIVGCGLNSDYHINFTKQYPASNIIAVVDNNMDNARRCARRYALPACYPDIGELFKHEKPDIIHIVTPPLTHFPLACEAIEAGCHVLIEKPMTLSLQDAESLYDLAERRGVRLCTMHNHFFDPCMLKARELIEQDKVGSIVNVESFYGMNTDIDAFRKYPAPNVLPWLYSLPGGVFHDFLAHPLYVMLPFLGKPLSVQVMEKSSGLLPQNISDELRILVEGVNALGNVTFSFAAKPLQHFVTIYGTRMAVKVNFDTMTITTHSVSNLPKAAQKATTNLSEAWQLTGNTIRNVWNFGTGKLRPYQGMKILIHRFYEALASEAELPVTKEEALSVIRVMDETWSRITRKTLHFEPIIPEAIPADKPSVLITGSTGFLGRALVGMFVKNGYRVRALVRKLSRIDKLKELDAEIFFGDVADPISLRQAFEGMDFVVHAAADTEGTEEGGDINTIGGTQNILDLCREFPLKKLIYISSCSVYGVANYLQGQVVTEDSPLEENPEARGAYTNAKFQAEKIVLETREDNEMCPVVCLRPGTIYGPGGEIYTPMMGFSLGNKLFLIIGAPGFILPLVSIDNVTDGVRVSLEKDESNGKIYNLIDPSQLTKKEYVKKVLRRVYPKGKFITFPYPLLKMIVHVQEIVLQKMKRRPFLTSYRLESSQKKIIYDGGRIQKDLNWVPPISQEDALQNMVESLLQNRDR